MPILATDTHNDIDITTFALVGLYTAPLNRASLIMNVLVDGVIGGGDYEIYITQQRGGVGSEYQSEPATIVGVDLGSSIKFPSMIIPTLATDVIRIYLKGLTGDVAVDVISEFWCLDTPLGIGVITWPVTLIDGANPLAGVRVWATTDIDGDVVVATGYTDAFGTATFMLDVGTYYIWKEYPGLTFTNPEATVVDVGLSGPVFLGTPITIVMGYYGTAAGVASLAKMWTRKGVWWDNVPPDGALPEIQGTNPTLTQVLMWLSDVSALINASLAGAGFTVPIINSTAFRACSVFAESLVADLCHAANSSGRLYSEKIVEKGLSPIILVNQQVGNWAESWTSGFRELGIPWHQQAQTPAFSVQPGKQL